MPREEDGSGSGQSRVRPDQLAKCTEKGTNKQKCWSKSKSGGAVERSQEVGAGRMVGAGRVEAGGSVHQRGSASVE